MSIPYWQLSSVYFFYFAILGATNPYWGLYLQSLGFNAEQIGSLMALFIATKLIAPNVWSYWADKSGRYERVMQLGAVLTPICFVGVFWTDQFWFMVAVMALYSFFWNAILPQYEVITLRALKGQEERYSQIRLWGSVGFILAVAGLGWWLDYAPVSTLPMAILVIMFAMAIVSFTVSGQMTVDRKSEQKNNAEQGIMYWLLKPHIVCFLLAVLLMQASHGPYYTFFSIFMEQYGYSRTVIGLLWALGVFAEVLLFLLMHKLLRWVKAEIILLVSLVLASVRWWFIGLYPESFYVMLLLQCLHAATFGSFHAASIALIHRLFPARHSGQGQAAYTSVGFGIGGALGAWGSGLIWQYFSAETSFQVASVTSGIAALIFFLSLYTQRSAWAVAE